MDPLPKLDSRPIDVSEGKKKIRLHPLSDRVVVRPDPPESQTKFGIYVPAMAKKQPQTGIIVWAGPGKVSEFPAGALFERLPMHLKPGDWILYGKYGGVEIEIERDKYIILRQTEVLALLTEESER